MPTSYRITSGVVVLLSALTACSNASARSTSSQPSVTPSVTRSLTTADFPAVFQSVSDQVDQQLAAAKDASSCAAIRTGKLPGWVVQLAQTVPAKVLDEANTYLIALKLNLAACEEGTDTAQARADLASAAADVRSGLAAASE